MTDTVKLPDAPDVFPPQYKIALTGPSGSGKTTLAHIIQYHYPEIKFIAGSADSIMGSSAQGYLFKRFGYEPKGHANVRAMSATNPDFGFEFQRLLLNNRTNTIRKNTNFVTDRSPIDNFTYYLDQVAHNQSPETTDDFLSQCQEAYLNLTHLIYVPSINPEGYVEDNGSRIANIWYQRKIDVLFEHNLTHYFIPYSNRVKVLFIDVWDLTERTKLVKEFLQ